MVSEASREPIVRARRPASTYVLPFFALLLVGLLLLWLIVNLVKEPADFMTVFFIGLTNGAVYALIALGYTLVYGILELINFAHGDVFMIGGMIAATVALQMFGVDEGTAVGVLVPAILVALVFAMVGCGLLNAGIERVAYKPLRGAPRLVPLITAVGMSFILWNVAIVWKGTQPVALPKTLSNDAIFTIGDCPNCVVYSWNGLFVLLITVPTLLALVWLVKYTKQGKAMRATAQDKDAAALMGIDVNRTISFTFLIAGALAG